MLRHVVMFSFAEQQDKTEMSKTVKNMLESLVEKIPELKRMEVGLNVNTRPSAFDIVLTADFNNENDLNAYRVHPAHKEVLDYLEGKTARSAVVDYYL